MKIFYCKEINIRGLRYPKFFNYKNRYYLIGGSLYQRAIYENNEIKNLQYFENEQDYNILTKNEKNQINKYMPIIFEINTDFEIIKNIEFNLNKEFDNDIFVSSWVRDISEKDRLYINVEHKKNIENKRFEDHNYQYSSDDFKDVIIEKVYNDIDSFLYKDLGDITINSEICKDESDKDYFWGKYLFYIKKNNKRIRPKFDKIVDYEKDKGHLMHNLIKTGDEEYLMLFSIRHLIKERDFVYKIYTSKTKNLEDFYDTEEVEIDGNNNFSFISYPDLFKMGDKWYIVCNQDDFGKFKRVLLFQVIF